jgi:membrane-associated phospholipid phosphatase
MLGQLHGAPLRIVNLGKTKGFGYSRAGALYIVNDMLWWSHLSALGGLNVTTLAALAVAGWLAGARCWRLALDWSLAFGAVLVVAAASQAAFIGWGLGWRGADFAGFSGHATRAAALFPVALFLLFERSRALRRFGLVLGALLALAVALARVRVGAHSPSEAALGWLLGSCAAGWFALRIRGGVREPAGKPLLVGLALPLLLLPYAEPVNSHQWLTALALELSGHDRPYQRATWEQDALRYVPPCAPQKVHLSWLCA